MVCGCVDVGNAGDGMFMEVRDERRLDWAFELVSGSNAWTTMLGDTWEGVVVFLFIPYILF